MIVHDVRSGAEAANGRGDRPAPLDADPAARSAPAVDRLFLVTVLAALLPIVVAVARAARRGWLPIGDNAYFAIRATDVLTRHQPLLGTWTSASNSAGTDFNNPGPLLFDALALPTKVIGGGIGVAVGAAALNCLAVIGIAVVARRRGGPTVGIAAMAVTALLCWSMGSELLFDPWQPHSLLLPFLFGLFLVWSLVCGDVAALPWAAGVASLIIQTHLSYLVLVVALATWGLVGCALCFRRRRAEEPEAWPRLRRTVRRSAVLAVLVLALCWAQPLIEQFTGAGEGNLSRLATNATGSGDKVGVELGTRIVGDILVPPFWFRPSFGEALIPNAVVPPGTDVLTSLDPSFGVAVGLVVAAASLLALAAVDARRRDDRVSSAALSTAMVAGGASLVTAWSLPTSFYGLPAHQFRWLWPMSAFATFAMAAWAARRPWRGPVTASASSWTAIALTAVTVVVAVANLPANNQKAGPTVDDWAIPVMRKLDPQMAALKGQGTLLIDFDGTKFSPFEPFTGPVMAELQRRHIPFVLEDKVMLRQFGTGRRVEGTPKRLLVVPGQRSLTAPPQGNRVALVEGLSPRERAERSALAERLTAYLQRLGRVPLTPTGMQALERPEWAVARSDVANRKDSAFVDSHVVEYLMRHDLLDLDAPWRARFERYADLNERFERDTVALFLKPYDAGR